jgi:hypothetical protein
VHMLERRSFFLLVGIVSLLTGCNEGESEGVAQLHVNLYDCGLPLDCEQMVGHADDIRPATALNCAAKQIVLGLPGVLDHLDSPGGACSQDEQLVILLGDDTALVQRRHRASSSTDCAPNDPWEASSAHQICDIVLADGTEAACQANEFGGCQWTPTGWASKGHLANCHDVEDWTCAAVTDLLE